MGQLEKYGLYVLCLVIFLILGVTIWGGGEPPPANQMTPNASIHAPASGRTPPMRSNEPAAGGVLDSLLRPAPTQEPKKPEPKAVDGNTQKGEGAVRDASAPPPAADAGKPAKPPTAAEQRPTYRIKKNDTFESVAKSRLGSIALRAELERLNPGVRPETLQIGQEIVLPSTAELAALKTPRAPVKEPAAKGNEAPAGERTYTIRKGDNFERIARIELGNSRRVAEIAELNPGVEPEKIRPGQRIKLPRK